MTSNIFVCWMWTDNHWPGTIAPRGCQSLGHASRMPVHSLLFRTLLTHAVQHWNKWYGDHDLSLVSISASRLPCWDTTYEDSYWLEKLGDIIEILFRTQFIDTNTVLSVCWPPVCHRQLKKQKVTRRVGWRLVSSRLGCVAWYVYMEILPTKDHIILWHSPFASFSYTYLGFDYWRVKSMCCRLPVSLVPSFLNWSCSQYRLPVSRHRFLCSEEIEHSFYFYRSGRLHSRIRYVMFRSLPT